MSGTDWLIVGQAARIVRATDAFAEEPMGRGRWDGLARELLELKVCFERAGVEHGASGALTSPRQSGVHPDVAKELAAAVDAFYAIEALAHVLGLDPSERFDRTAIAGLIEREARRGGAMVNTVLDGSGRASTGRSAPDAPP